MNIIISQRYQAGDSLLHRLDPRVKVMAVLLVIIGIVLTPDFAWVAYPLLWTLLGVLAVTGGVGVWRLNRLAGLALPFTLAAITLLVTTPGHPLVSIGSFNITDAGLGRFLGIVLKSWLAMQAALVFAITTHFTDLLWALESLGVPEVLIAIIGFMYRYLFTLKDEAERLLRARAARSGTAAGYKAGGGLRWRAQVTGGMVGNLFLRSYERSERVHAAMLARGYNGQIKRRENPPLTWKAMALGAVPVVVVVIIQIAVRL